MNKNRRRGKDLERFLAKDLNGRRIGILGHEDIITERFSIEAKERKEHPTFLKKAIAQAIRNSREEKIPVFILHRLYDEHENDLVIMQYADWKKLFANKKS